MWWWWWWGLDPVVRYRVHAGGARTSEVATQAQVNTQTLRYYVLSDSPGEHDGIVLRHVG